MNLRALTFTTAIALLLGGCAATSSSSAPYVAFSEQTVGPVFITQEELPADIAYDVIGQVQAKAKTGYSGARTLYPLLVEEARKVGANAVINVYGGRAWSGVSLAAPYTAGTAVKVKDTEALKTIDGLYF